MIYLYIENNNFYSQIDYTFSNIFSILGLSYKTIYSVDKEFYTERKPNDIIIFYLDKLFTENIKLDNSIIITNSKKVFGENYLLGESIPTGVMYYHLEKPRVGLSDIISIFNDGELLISKKDNCIITNMDIISDIFFMLTRYEEAINTKAYCKDNHYRYPASESLAFKCNFLNRPIVNEHIELIWSWIEGFSLGYERKKWWKDKDYALFISHDIDAVQKYKSPFLAARSMLGQLMKFNVESGFNCIRDYMKATHDYKQDPYWTFEYITKIEKTYDFKSSFYFMNGGDSPYDGRYNLSDNRLLDEIYNLVQNGFEVGYHGSYDSFDALDIIRLEKKAIDDCQGNVKYGCRQHYLRFQVPYTWRIQAQSGLLYDTSLAFAEHEGFRCGTCFPYKPYDLLDNRVIDIWELPLIVMDTTLASKKYRCMNPQSALGSIIQLIEIVKLYGGVFSILWHNTSFDSNWDGWQQTYEDLMKYFSLSNCISLTGCEIVGVFEGTR